MLDFELIHNSSEGLFQFVYFFIELLSNFHFKLIVELFVDRNGLIVPLNFTDHFFDHFLHFINFWRNLNNLMLHFRVFKNTFRTKHLSVILAIEFHFLRRMNITESHSCSLVCINIIWISTGISGNSDTHWKGCQDWVIDW